ncbi:cytochrome c biogenesis CcdA family protein [Microbacterium aerolatum]|uniref:Cytochrome c biogenesis protein n=1 Tax=Microbacterium aerolatum TaxID=153731 RepID=A0A511AKA7_9MICO|nr:cytochrome c biogenesis protein CcdA [Microbacterium aerolatum]GEK86327.1 cytochrome c biogenesis protein [Microbacterium aerolatum]GGB17072.1 cytochrome c biogenesis protein [Microbacterium aerolatum]
MNTSELIGSGALWLAIPVAMLAGLVSFLSPCVLPLVPGYLGFIGGAVAPRGAATNDAAPNRGRLVLGVLLFILGFSIVFIAFTIIGGAASVFFLQWGDLITRILGVVIIAMGLVFLGLFGFAQREWRMHVTSKTGLIGAPLLGFALGIGWAPCIGPTLTAITAVSWTLGDPWRASFLGLAYSLGLGIPFLLVALGFGWATKTIGFLRRHIRVVNIIGGVLLIALGVLMVTGLWTDLMSRLTAVMGSVILPL